jgi:hypothetical protein
MIDSGSNVKKWLVCLFISQLVLGCGDVNESAEKSGWKEVEPASLSKPYQQMYERTERAKKDLAKTLLGRVTEVMRKQGPRAAISVCNLEASGLTSQVAEKHDVRIGRTSHKLRNPNNQPPEWMREFNIVEKKIDKQMVLQRDDTLAVASPIHLAEKCATCHGPKDKLNSAVINELEQRYPQDEATGFEPGDLRGWFWVTTSTK